MRASSLDLITKNQAQYLWKQISARRLRLREPPELDFEPERPSVIETMLRVHMDALGYSRRELSQLLHIPEHGLKEFYDLSEPKETPRPKFTIMR